MKYYLNECCGGITEIENPETIKQLNQFKDLKVDQELTINLTHPIYAKVEEATKDKVIIKVILERRN